MIATIGRIDWREFLRRPLLPRSSPAIQDGVAHSPILITGAGGSIGAALALRLAESSASRVVLLDANENHLFRLQQSIARARDDRGSVFVLGNAGDAAVLEDLFVVNRPRIVFHAAAYKHVPLLETQPFAAIANNVFATEVLVATATKHGARVVLLSTDKAVQPTSAMGVTKRVAERIALMNGGTVLRLANVLGSSGSVTEIFQEQIACGVPLTVTHPDARRYFLTIEEAVDLLLAAALTVVNNESAEVLVPALDTDHSISELAAFILRAVRKGRKIPIQFTGLRPGDKLVERLWDDDESASPRGRDLLSIRSKHPELRDLATGTVALRGAVEKRDLASALQQLCDLVPGYCPSETVLALAKTGASRVCV